MNRHVIIAFDNAVKQGTYDFTLNTSWPSIMRVRQIEYHNDGTVTGSLMLWGDWVPDQGIFGICHDGTSVAPQTEFYIPSELQGNHTIKLQTAAGANSTSNGIVMILLEFSPQSSAEEKKSR